MPESKSTDASPNEPKATAFIELEAAKDEDFSSMTTSVKGSFTPPLVAAWFISLLGPFQFGFNVGVSGAVHEDDVFPGHSSFQWSVCVAIFSIGGLIGALGAGPVGGLWARRRSLLLAAIGFTIAGLLMMFAANIYMLILGRFVVGVAAGATSVFVPLYHREVSSPNLRGTLGTGYQVAVTLGILFADLLAFAFSGEYHNVGEPGWRLLLGFSAILGILQVLLLPMLPETPNWLLGADRKEQALTVLTRLRGKRMAESDVAIELQSIRDDLQQQAQALEHQITVVEVLRDRSLRRPLVLGCLLQVIQQMSGINAVMFYANQFFEDAGLDNPQVGTALVGTINFLSTLVALVFVDRAGRRPLLIWSCAGMLVAQIVLTLALLGLLPISVTLSVIGMLAFVAFFEFGYGSIPWLITGEVMPPAPRVTAMSIAMVVQWFFTFLIGLIYPSMQSGLDKYSFVPFTVCLALSMVFTLRYVPETKGMTVEEIHHDMELRKRAKSTQIQ